jgi:hypothetical protein
MLIRGYSIFYSFRFTRSFPFHHSRSLTLIAGTSAVQLHHIPDSTLGDWGYFMVGFKARRLYRSALCFLSQKRL